MPASPFARGLTGASRYRRGWFGALIFQVEEFEDQLRGRPCIGDLPPVSKWRDATERDLIGLDYLDRRTRAADTRAAPPPPPDW